MTELDIYLENLRSDCKYPIIQMIKFYNFYYKPDDTL
jgi:hypothetical protein